MPGNGFGFLGAVLRQGGAGAAPGEAGMELEISQCSAYSILHSTTKQSNRVIVSSFPEPKVWECCWGILFQPDFALNAASIAGLESWRSTGLG